MGARKLSRQHLWGNAPRVAVLLARFAGDAITIVTGFWEDQVVLVQIRGMGVDHPAGGPLRGDQAQLWVRTIRVQHWWVQHHLRPDQV